MNRLIAYIFAPFVFLCPIAVLAQNDTQFDPPRNEHGHPDFQGNWTNRLATPYQRPVDLGERATYSAEEAAQFQNSAQDERARSLAPLDPNRPAPNSEDGVDQSAEDIFTPDVLDLLVIEGEVRTSVITDPPNGRIPFRADAHQKDYYAQLRSLGLGRYDGPEVMYATPRCLSIWGPLPPLRGRPPETPNFKIVQTKTHLVFYQELGGTTRIIKLNGNTLPANIPQWHGDSVGYWDNDTLVVETNNFSPLNSNPQILVSDEFSAREEFRIISDYEIFYRFTITDPVMYSSPFSGELVLKRMPHGERIFEFACHEGNHSITGILAGARRQEMDNARGY
jgi:hypothetical protein